MHLVVQLENTRHEKENGKDGPTTETHVMNGAQWETGALRLAVLVGGDEDGNTREGRPAG